MATVIEEAELNLKNAVDAARYRRSTDHQITDRYVWPMSESEVDGILNAALQLVLVKEQAAAVAEICLRK